MEFERSVETISELRRGFQRADVHRPMRVERHQVGDELTYEARGLVPDRPALLRVKIEKFVGGGFAGQVYKVTLLEMDAPDGPVEGLTVGGTYAIKVLLPPSGKARMFREFLYRIIDPSRPFTASFGGHPLGNVERDCGYVRHQLARARCELSDHLARLRPFGRGLLHHVADPS